MWSFASLPTLAAPLLNGGGFDGVLRLMASHPTSPQVQRCGCGAIARLLEASRSSHSSGIGGGSIRGGADTDTDADAVTGNAAASSAEASPSAPAPASPPSPPLLPPPAVLAAPVLAAARAHPTEPTIQALVMEVAAVLVASPSAPPPLPVASPATSGSPGSDGPPATPGPPGTPGPPATPGSPGPQPGLPAEMAAEALALAPAATASLPDSPDVAEHACYLLSSALAPPLAAHGHALVFLPLAFGALRRHPKQRELTVAVCHLLREMCEAPSRPSSPLLAQYQAAIDAAAAASVALASRAAAEMGTAADAANASSTSDASVASAAAPNSPNSPSAVATADILVATENGGVPGALLAAGALPALLDVARDFIDDRDALEPALAVLRCVGSFVPECMGSFVRLGGQRGSVQNEERPPSWC